MRASKSSATPQAHLGRRRPDLSSPVRRIARRLGFQDCSQSSARPSGYRWSPTGDGRQWLGCRHDQRGYHCPSKTGETPCRPADELAQKYLLSLGSLNAAAKPMVELAPALHGSAGVLGYALNSEFCGQIGRNLDHADRPLREGEHVAGLRKADASKQRLQWNRSELSTSGSRAFGTRNVRMFSGLRRSLGCEPESAKATRPSCVRARRGSSENGPCSDAVSHSCERKTFDHLARCRVDPEFADRRIRSERRALEAIPKMIAIASHSIA